MEDPERTTERANDAALFYQLDEPEFVANALARFDAEPLIVSDDNAFCADAAAARRISFAELALDVTPLDEEAIRHALMTAIKAMPAALLVVDMAWAQAQVIGVQPIEIWGRLTQWLSEETGTDVVSVYAREKLIELHMQAAFQAHRQFLAPSGLYENPHWLPANLLVGSTQDQQLAFLLGRVVPDYAGARFFTKDDRMFARGAAPDWLKLPQKVAMVRNTGARWHIHCFGQLRVYVDGVRRVDWRGPGASPKKTKALFAYLLQSGETGAQVDELGELLWPGEGDEATKRARLHHTVAMLRKALGGKDAVQRGGDYYRLNVPSGSWMDITSFEQLCRRGLSLAKSDRADAALEQYRTAEALYQGDLFADLPAEYIDAVGEDWVLPKRTWLREMAIKLHRDMSILLRSKGRLREALEHCQKALALDPVSEDANIESLRVLHAQGRLDAMQRQFRQYRAALADMGESADYQEIQALYRALTSNVSHRG